MLITLLCKSQGIDSKAVCTTEKLGTDPTRKEYGPDIFARVNFGDHVFWHGYGPVFFSVLGP